MTKKDAFFRLVQMLEHEGIRYALVGNTDEYPDHIGSDVDIVTYENGLAKFHHSAWSLEDAGLRVIQRFQHEITAFYYILAFRSPENRWDFIQPDICTDYYRRARKLLDAAPMLERRRRKACLGCPGGGFFVLAPQDEFVYYLLKKIGKASLSAEQFHHLHGTFSEDPEGCSERLASLGPAATRALAAVEANDCERLSASLPELKRGLLSSGYIGRPRRFRDAYRKLRRILHPTGFVAVLSGPDADKTAKSLHEELAGAFRRQADLSVRSHGLFRNLLKAKIASTLVVLDAMPPWPARWLVDAVFVTPTNPASSIVACLSARARKRVSALRTSK